MSRNEIKENDLSTNILQLYRTNPLFPMKEVGYQSSYLLLCQFLIDFIRIQEWEIHVVLELRVDLNVIVNRNFVHDFCNDRSSVALRGGADASVIFNYGVYATVARTKRIWARSDTLLSRARALSNRRPEKEKHYLKFNGC